jgi:ubiquinone/menaquinone biosynthesis C-methylase UbiE
MKRPTERFSGRVEHYVQYRPDYPRSLIDALIQSCRLDARSVVADIGSGTGIFTRQLLEQQLRVIAIEPNQEMRLAAENILSGYARFSSLSGRAECTGLDDRVVDLITSAQAFHWFEAAATHVEFSRILKASGWLALIWNRRKLQDPLQRDYDALLSEFAPEYDRVNHMNIEDSAIQAFFSLNSYRTSVFANPQILDRERFLGRLKSASYLPAAETSGWKKILRSANALFSKYELDGHVRFEYDACLHLGQLSSAWKNA